MPHFIQVTGIKITKHQETKASNLRVCKLKQSEEDRQVRITLAEGDSGSFNVKDLVHPGHVDSI